MRRVLKWVAILVGVVVVLLIVAVGAIYVLSNSHMSKHFTVEVQAPPVPAGPAAVKEGERVYVTRACADCHGADLAGKVVVDDPIVGRFAGANLTKGKGGLGNELTDVDIVRAVRHGVKPDGSAMIFMPSTDFHAMSDPDMGALTAYIRSVPPVDKPSLPQKPGPLARLLFLQGKMAYLVSAEYIDHTAKPSTITPGVTAEYGRYMADGCTGCHGFGFSGGPIPGAPPEWLPAANITPHPVTGLGKWSEADFSKAVREGVRPDGVKVRFPMPWQNFSHLNDTEVKALWMFLKTVPMKEAGGR
jgi:mono/diheme cytochrome c family protein